MHKAQKTVVVIGNGMVGHRFCERLLEFDIGKTCEIVTFCEEPRAAYDLGLETHVVEFAPRLMPRQIDDAGSKLLVEKINALGVQVHLNKNTKEILGNGKVEGMTFADGGELDVKMVVVSAGIKPRDDLAKASGLMVGQRGGVVVDD